MVPSAWVTLNKFPLTPNGKVDRKALPAPQLRSDDMGTYAPPVTETERSLCEIWAQVLRVDRVGTTDNFFEIGGHSLLGMKLIAKITDRFSVRFSVAAVFAYPTVMQMAEAIAALQASQRDSDGRLRFEEGVI
jgi:acyl carrier protein